MVVVLIAGAIAGGVFWHISASYQPLRSAGWYGPQPGYPIHVRWTNGSTEHRLLGPVGTTQHFEWALINDGSHPVTITTIDRAYPDDLPGRPVIRAVTWAPYRAWPGGPINGHPSRSQPFPAHIAAHGVIKVRFTVRKPACKSGPGRSTGVSVMMRVRWHAMISSHTTLIDPASDDQYAVVVC